MLRRHSLLTLDRYQVSGQSELAALLDGEAILRRAVPVGLPWFSRRRSPSFCSIKFFSQLYDALVGQGIVPPENCSRY